MALLSCPECDGHVSDRASSCPHCAYPIQEDIESALPVDSEDGVGVAESVPISTRLSSVDPPPEMSNDKRNESEKTELLPLLLIVGNIIFWGGLGLAGGQAVLILLGFLICGGILVFAILQAVWKAIHREE